MAIKVWDGDSIETPQAIAIRMTDGTLRLVNYIVVKETDGSLTTAWNAIYTTTRNTTGTYATTYSTSKTTTTTYNTSKTT